VIARSGWRRKIRRATAFVRKNGLSDVMMAVGLSLRSMLPGYREQVIGNVPTFVRTDIDVARVAWLEHRWAAETLNLTPAAAEVELPSGPGYWICMVPRCGSTYLSQLLIRTGVLGRPQEYLNIEGVYRREARAAGFESYLRQVRVDAATSNGVHGMKVTFDHIAHLIQRDLFPLPSDRYVYLTREDVLMQGISFYRAVRSGVWTEPSARTPRPVEYDAEAIWEHVDMLVRMMSQWERLFAWYGIQPLRLTYEELVSSPAEAVRAIAELMGVEIEMSQIPTTAGFHQQRDRQSTAWATRLRAEARP
jgi:trehalose 2-sulfotransferase